MAKDPVLPLYYNDISTSTADWNDEEFGAYVRLLIHQWRNGGLPNDYQRLTRLATSLPTNWDMLKSKFPLTDGLLKNGYMEEIRAKRARHKEKQTDNIKKRYQTSTKQSTKSLPLEEEIENENEIELIGEPGEFFVTVGTAYVGQAPKRIYDLKLHFENTGQRFQLDRAGHSNYSGFMRDKPAAHFNDDRHLYNAFKMYGNRKQISSDRDRSEWANKEAAIIQAHSGD